MTRLSWISYKPFNCQSLRHPPVPQTPASASTHRAAPLAAKLTPTMETHHFIYTTMLHPAEAPQPSQILQTEAQAIETAAEISRRVGINIRVLHPDDYHMVCQFTNGERLDNPKL